MSVFCRPHITLKRKGVVHTLHPRVGTLLAQVGRFVGLGYGFPLSTASLATAWRAPCLLRPEPRAFSAQPTSLQRAAVATIP